MKMSAFEKGEEINRSTTERSPGRRRVFIGPWKQETSDEWKRYFKWERKGLQEQRKGRKNIAGLTSPGKLARATGKEGGMGHALPVAIANRVFQALALMQWKAFELFRIRKYD